MILLVLSFLLPSRNLPFSVISASDPESTPLRHSGLEPESTLLRHSGLAPESTIMFLC